MNIKGQIYIISAVIFSAIMFSLVYYFENDIYYDEKIERIIFSLETYISSGYNTSCDNFLSIFKKYVSSNDVFYVVVKREGGIEWCGSSISVIYTNKGSVLINIANRTKKEVYFTENKAVYGVIADNKLYIRERNIR